MSATEILTARIPADPKRRIEAQAQEAGGSVSEFVCERLDRAYVDEQELDARLGRVRRWARGGKLAP